MIPNHCPQPRTERFTANIYSRQCYMSLRLIPRFVNSDLVEAPKEHMAYTHSIQVYRNNPSFRRASFNSRMPSTTENLIFLPGP